MDFHHLQSNSIMGQALNHESTPEHEVASEYEYASEEDSASEDESTSRDKPNASEHDDQEDLEIVFDFFKKLPPELRIMIW